MTTPAHVPLDRLDTGDALEVRLLEDARIGDAPPREPHRHDYHELIWVREGCGVHLLDGEPQELQAGAVTLIGRGQVHTMQRGEGLTGAVVRFGEELLHGAAGERATPGWLLVGRGGRTVPVPAGEADHLDGAIGALAGEARRPPDARSGDIERHLLALILLWVERWYDAGRTERREADDPEIDLYRRFAELLEHDFAAHHDAAHYADALAVPPAALSRSLSHVAGRSTKELVTDRVMLEAARLLRFTDRTVGEVSYAVGFTDPLYFSRAFKRHFGLAPMAYRDRARGR